ncbi:MAG: hypothetical protein ACWGOY_11790 [Anaerolineales bacterium]
MNKKRILIISVGLGLTLLIANCSSNEAEEREATAQALSESIYQTATAAAAEAFNPEANQATIEAQATARSAAAAATQTALASEGQQVSDATAQAAAPIKAELPKYEVDPNAGQVGWIHPPLALHTEGYMEYDYGNQFLGTVAEDFVVSSDITWNTQYGTSACGFVVRSDGNEEAFNQYLILATRGGNGRVIFNTMADGEVLDGYDLYAYGLDPKFDWQNDSTNRLTVVGRGTEFTIFTNDTQIGVINAGEPPPAPYIPPAPARPANEASKEEKEAYDLAKKEYDQAVGEIWANYNARMEVYEDHGTEFLRGFIAMVALAESGYTDCQFDNTWLWLIDKQDAGE